MSTIIYNCKRCKTGKRIDYPENNRYRRNSEGKMVCGGIWIRSCGGGQPTMYDGDIEAGICPTCKRMMDYSFLKGRLSPEHKCDARCTGARGGNCECSCGGTNHGKDWI